MAFGPGWPSKRAYTFEPGSDYPSGRIVLWDNTTPTSGNTILLQIAGNPLDPTAIPIRELYFPVLYGAVNLYFGQTVPASGGGTIDYTTQSSGCECIDFDGVFFVLAEYVGGYPGQSAYVFLRNLPTGAFRTGPLGAQVTAINVTAPITESGSPTSPTIGLATPLAVAYGGTGTTTPQLIAGSGITITGTAFDWTISTNGGTGVSDIVLTNSASPSDVPASITNPTGPTATINFNTPFDLVNGGTGYSAPGTTNTGNIPGNITAGTGIAITGAIFDPNSPGGWTFTNIGVTGAMASGASHALVGTVQFESNDNSLNITNDTMGSDNAINFELNNPVGFCIAVVQEMSVTAINGSGATASLGELPNGNWYVEVIVHGFGLGNPGGSNTNGISLTGGGGFGVTDAITQAQGTRTLYQCAVVGAGNSPTVTVQATMGTVTLNSGSSYVSCGFKAIRIS